MATKQRKKASAKTTNVRFIGKPSGQIQQRVQAVGPEHFGIVAVDCAKKRSKWMLCDFYGRVLIEPTIVEHSKGGLATMTDLIAVAKQTIKDLNEAFKWLPKSSYAAEAKPLLGDAGKRRRGVTSLGDLLIPLLIRLGVHDAEQVESKTSEARGSH